MVSSKVGKYFRDKHAWIPSLLCLRVCVSTNTNCLLISSPSEVCGCSCSVVRLWPVELWTCGIFQFFTMCLSIRSKMADRRPFSLGWNVMKLLYNARFLSLFVDWTEVLPFKRSFWSCNFCFVCYYFCCCFDATLISKIQNQIKCLYCDILCEITEQNLAIM